MSVLPQKPPAIAINLIPQDPFLESIIGKFLLWALSIGRYIVVLTELIVIMSFLSRFKLDRDLTDLNEKIANQKAIILSYQSTENEFRTIQSRLDFLSKKQQESTVLSSLDFLQKQLPIDVKLDKLSVNPTGWSLSASSLSAQGMKTAVDLIVRQNPQSEVSLGSVKLDSRAGTINFDVRLDRKQTVTTEKNPSKKTTETDEGI